jgi:hypothetical protein
VPVNKHGAPLRGEVVMFPETEVLIKINAIEIQQAWPSIWMGTQSRSSNSLKKK